MRVAFRADASLAIGSGHVMRCLCLADRLKEAGAETAFVSRDLPPFMRRQLEEGGHDFVTLSAVASASEIDDAQETLRQIGEADRVVVDHYGLGAEWERAVQAKAPVLAIDDLARTHESDLVLDQNFYANGERRYEGRLASGAAALVGPRYALLRPEFVRARSRVGIRKRGVRRIMVFLGGMDGDNVTSLALKALDLARIPDVRVDVVAGAMHPALDGVRQWCAARPLAELHVQVSYMAELMLASDLAIGAGGQTTWERCSVALPTIAICLADNQREVVREGVRAGFLHGLDGIPTAEDLADDIRFFVRHPAVLETMSRRAYEIVDARGVDRMAAMLCPATVQVRDATIDDASSLYAWRTDARIRQVSRNPELFSFDEHCAWMQRALADPTRMLLIGEHDGRAVGAVRFDFRGTKSEVSIFLNPERWGGGLGSALLQAGERCLKRRRPEIGLIEAWVNEGNEASQRMFVRGGYDLRSRLFEKRI